MNLIPEYEDYNIISTCVTTEKPNKIIQPANIGQTKEIFSGVELTRRYLHLDFYNVPDFDNKEYFPLAVYSSYFDNRMAAQKGSFTIFGNTINGLLENKHREKFLDKICIDGSFKPRILKELSLLGINDEAIYPDLDGLGKTIMKDVYTKFKGEYLNAGTPQFNTYIDNIED